MDWQIAGGADLKLKIKVKQPIFKVTSKEIEILLTFQKLRDYEDFLEKIGDYLYNQAPSGLGGYYPLNVVSFRLFD